VHERGGGAEKACVTSKEPKDPPDQDPDANDQKRSTTGDHDRRLTIPANAHAHEDDPPQTSSPGSFPQDKLDAYRVALEMAALAKDLAKEIPRGHRSLADHLLRSAGNTALLLGEGANRRGRGLKRQRFVESRGECGEVAAAADLVIAMEIGSEAKARRLKGLAGRVSAMLTRLIALFE
jgi:four helix bundle protein